MAEGPGGSIAPDHDVYDGDDGDYVEDDGDDNCGYEQGRSVAEAHVISS